MPDHLARIRRAFKGERRPGQLYWWFWDNWDSLEHGEKGISWIVVSDSLNKLGVRVRVGEEERRVTPETARRTYARVKADKASSPNTGYNHQRRQPPGIGREARSTISMVPAKHKE